MAPMAKDGQNAIKPAPDGTQIPNIVDTQGRLIDINSTTGMPQFVTEGQEGPGSIFHVPEAESRRTKPRNTGKFDPNNISIADLLAQSRLQGFSGQNFIVDSKSRPGDAEKYEEKRLAFKNSLPHARKNYRVTDGQAPLCFYCQIMMENEQHSKGVDLQELYEVAKAGCEPCDVLQQAITYFAKMVYLKYDKNRVWVKQSQNMPSLLLSQTKMVEVRFEEYQDEILTLSFSADESQEDETGLLAGRIEDKGSEAAMRLIEGWLGKCMDTHGPCHVPGLPPLPQRVLEISADSIRLVETDGLRAPYVTLSHCWGRSTWTQMTTQNLDILKEEIPWGMLSNTFQDAVQITHRLGFQYLWIDGLCILQDDREDWEYNVSRMSEIFSNSQLTIAASHASNGDQGCFYRHAENGLNLQGAKSRFIRNNLLWKSYRLDGRDRDGYPRKFIAQLKTPHGLYRGRNPQEPLLKRAWVLQEQILSPRIIHFASGELYFECKSHVACECSGWSPRTLTTQWETRWRKAYEVLREPRQAQQQQQQQQEDDEKAISKRRMRHFEAHRALIETYTELDITSEMDRLPALSGIAFGRQDDQYLAGMWGEILHESLHWAPKPFGKRHMARRPWSYRAPTWSWASVEAPIRHEITDFHKFAGSAKLTGTIVKASCTARGLDPHGEVSSGFLVMRGPTLEVRVTEVGFRYRDMHVDLAAGLGERPMDVMIKNGFRRREDYEYYSYAMLKGPEYEAPCYLDIPLALCKLPPAEVSVGDELLLLVISTVIVLVLKPRLGEPGVYTRVGIFTAQKDKWLYPHTGKNIVIV